MCMHAAPWPEPDPQVAAVIEAIYGTRKTPRPLAVLIRDRLGQGLGDEAVAPPVGARGKPGRGPPRPAVGAGAARGGQATHRPGGESGGGGGGLGKPPGPPPP